MRLRQFLIAGSVLSFVILVTAQQCSSLSGCAMALRPGEQSSIFDEAALIVWDQKTRTEHFVRRANFETKTSDFGFLVPTPTQPDLGEVANEVFTSVSKLTAPEHVYESKTIYEFGFLGLPAPAKSVASAPAGLALPKSVDVLHQQAVAGFEATVLRAEDPEALRQWLEKHGYEADPELTEWLKWYVDHKWIITAFKLSKATEQSDRLETKSVRMSFHCDQPFYPYREPEETRNSSSSGHRTLRVYFLADQRYTGTIGESGDWSGTTEWSGDISGKNQDLIAQLKLADSEVASGLEDLRHVTEFQDLSFPRPGTDEVYFRPAKDQSTVKRPPIIHTSYEVVVLPGSWTAVVLPFVVLVGIVSITYRFRRTNRREAMEH